MISFQRIIINPKWYFRTISKPSIIVDSAVVHRTLTSPAVKRYRQRQDVSKPNLDIASTMASNYQEMSNELLVRIAAMDNHDARSEVLKRHIMAVDCVSYDDACTTFRTIQNKNEEGSLLAAIPYFISVVIPITAACVSIPLVFHLGTAEWFNDNFVTDDIPPKDDLETPLEVGGWTWNWMEPILVESTFLLLCLQFSKAQLRRLGARTFTLRIKEIRAKGLSRSFPQYDARIVEDFSKTDVLRPRKFEWPPQRPSNKLDRSIHFRK